ncbi:hypothetical protein PV325_003491 [Microctonus aethiopoides]|nr:hypothetical protein PV325_003491 [Microctonus aethiopoides]
MKVANNMLKSTLISIAIIIISAVSITISVPQYDDAVEKIIRPPICRNLNAHRYVFTTVWLSAKSTINEPLPKEFILDYSDYAPTFSEFEEMYPNFTLKIHGIAQSDETFGDLAKNKFGERTYPTSIFNRTPGVNYDVIVNGSDKKSLSYSVSANIKVGFLLEVYSLYILPHISGELVSHGFYKRHLNLAVDVHSITFHPRT